MPRDYRRGSGPGSASPAHCSCWPVPCAAAPSAALHDHLQVAEDLSLELIDRLLEGALEVDVAVLVLGEGAEVVDHSREPIALDQVVGHEEGELVGGQRAFLEMAHGEAAGTSERLQIEARRHQRGVIADPGAGDPAPMLNGVEAHALEHGE